MHTMLYGPEGLEVMAGFDEKEMDAVYQKFQKLAKEGKIKIKDTSSIIADGDFTTKEAFAIGLIVGDLYATNGVVDTLTHDLAECMTPGDEEKHE